MYKAVFIDVDNTLLDFDLCAKDSMKRAFYDFGLDYKEETFSEFIRINDGLWRSVERGELTREGLRLVRWNIIFKSLGISVDGVEFEKLFSRYLWHSSEKVNHADELLEYLHKKYVVCVTSNAYQEQQLTRLTNAGIIDNVDHVFTSELLGASKPSRGFFDGCFARLDGKYNIKKDDVLVVGDSITADVKGAIEYGLGVCWFDQKRSELPKDLVPDFIVHDLLDICKII